MKTLLQLLLFVLLAPLMLVALLFILPFALLAAPEGGLE